MTTEERATLASALAGVTSPNERLALASSILQEAFAASGVDLVVVGGAALGTWNPPHR